MRDPKTIREILSRIERVWLNYPSLRLGQLLVNAAPPRFGSDIFYIEDSDMIKYLSIFDKFGETDGNTKLAKQEKPPRARKNSRKKAS